MRPVTLMRIAYGLAAFVLLLGGGAVPIFAVVGALTGRAGYLSTRSSATGTGSDVE